MQPMMQPPTPQSPTPRPAAAAAPKPKPKPKAATSTRPVATGSIDGGGAGGGTRISVLVNGEPITAYEIEQRARLLALQTNIQDRVQSNMKQLATSDSVNARWKEIVQETINANPGKSREQVIAIVQERQKSFAQGLQKQAAESARASVLPGLRTEARKELIGEQIKLQEAKAVGATPDESAIDDLVKDIASRNKMTPQQFTQHFAGLGVDISTFKARFRAQLAWSDAIRRKFGHLAVPNNRDIDRLVQKDGGGEDQVELDLQRIIVPIPAKLDQNAMAQRLAEAEGLQRQFTSCKSTGTLAAKVPGARLEKIGSRLASSFPEPTKTMLANVSKNEDMIPPTMTSGGIELLAVCSRRVVKAVEEKRNQKAAELRQGNFELLSRKHLRDLTDSAVVENR